ncbi:MAG: orotate phosphoribosyltransferase [Clostridiales bacterium]|uniref:orotate phosphoribosyltransferase n=1 Tax=Aminipila sp. TaxID=2060095 RepID=UPI001D3BED9F|nr:orotate phosphoribosyltransferase [Aminipila sp.]MBE6033744.1 orotate phosphoribosyltransferase [Clostridiales bacterium]
MSYKKEFIEFMVRAGVLTFGDFTTKSGRKTPYFVNTGNYKTGAQADKLGYFYASCIIENMEKGMISENIASLFGPAYKGIPISVATAIAMSREFDRDINYCFNRKEEKDHGEGGKMVGYKLQDGDSVLMVEDVITAGTAVRETLPQLMAAAKIKVEGLIISVDRMERGQGQKTAIQEIEEEFGIKTYPLVTVREIIDTLYNKEVDGKILIDDSVKERMEEYLEQYCVQQQ